MYHGLMAFAFGILEDLVKEPDFFNSIGFGTTFLWRKSCTDTTLAASSTSWGSDSAAVIYPLTLLEQLTSPSLASCMWNDSVRSFLFLQIYGSQPLRLITEGWFISVSGVDTLLSCIMMELTSYISDFAELDPWDASRNLLPVKSCLIVDHLIQIWLFSLGTWNFTNMSEGETVQEASQW